MEPRKVLTAAQMRQVDRKTAELGIPGIVLMENAAHRVVEFIASRFAPLHRQRVLVVCGKGNNGGDGLAIARQLFTRFRTDSLDVLLTAPPDALTGDAAANYRMWIACGGAVELAIQPRMRAATLIVDAVLGSGLTGPARGAALDWIREINAGFQSARVVAVDVPSGMPSDSGDSAGEIADADATVTFTAPRHCHVLAPNCRKLGVLHIAPIGSPPSLYQDDPTVQLALVEPRVFRDLLGPRDPGGNKGSYGHVLVVAGSRGKTGAAAMAGLAALRAGAGLVTVASVESAIPSIAAHAPELMTEPLAELPNGAIAAGALEALGQLAEKRSVVAIGPGIGTSDETAAVVRSLFANSAKPMVVDADALNILAAGDWPTTPDRLRVLTPHPGEMARLTNSTINRVQSDRIACAREFAAARGVVLVLKGERSLLAFPDGRVWVNPTGSPSMATGGTGDILTGMIAGFLGQFPDSPREAIAAAVWLHGRCGEIGALEIGEQPFIATDILRMLPLAMKQVRDAEFCDPNFL
jgi:NAD(P)H-hydrate epimerase